MDGIEARDVSFGFPGGPTVLEGVDLHVNPGEFVVVVGRSGSGKSTLLRLLAGLLRPDSGAVTIKGLAAERALPRRQMGFMWQEESLLPWATTLENVQLPMQVARVPATESAARATAALAKVGLEDAASKRPAELSGGMKQRVALARALVLKPQFLLLDEPFSALDDITREPLLHDVHRLVLDAGMTCVMATHNLMDAATVADRVLVLAGGPASVRRELSFARRPKARRDVLAVLGDITSCLRDLRDIHGRATG